MSSLNLESTLFGSIPVTIFTAKLQPYVAVMVSIPHLPREKATIELELFHSSTLYADITSKRKMKRAGHDAL